MLPVQCLAVDILDRVTAMHSFQESVTGSISDYSSLQAKMLGRDSFMLALKSQSVYSPALGLVSTSEFGDSALSPAERELVPQEVLDCGNTARELLLLQQLGYHVDTGASTAADWVSMLLDHVDTVPSPSQLSTATLLKQRGVGSRAERAVRAQLASAELAKLCVQPSMKAAAAVVVAINEDGRCTESHCCACCDCLD
jgi:hypothetical protein